MQKLYKLHSCLHGELSRTPANMLVFTWQDAGSMRYLSFRCYSKEVMMQAFKDGTLGVRPYELKAYLKACKSCKKPTVHPGTVTSEK